MEGNEASSRLHRLADRTPDDAAQRETELMLDRTGLCPLLATP